MRINTMDKFVIWSDEILKVIKSLKKEYPVFAKIGDSGFKRISGIEDSQNVGWWEIRFEDCYSLPTITSSYLMTNLPNDVMVMLQEGGHSGKSYPINSIFITSNEYMILRCDNPDSEYWEELEKWKIREDNIKLAITKFMKDKLERRKVSKELFAENSVTQHD